MVSLSLLFKNAPKKESLLPKISMIVPAYKEDKIIFDKIQNTLEMNYPKDQFQLIIVCDEMEANTINRLFALGDERIKILVNTDRKGKSHALNIGVAHAKNEIIFFSDANTINDKNVLKNIVQSFADPKVGGVCGRKSVINSSERRAGLGDNFFWKLESFIKTRESLVHSISTADGEIFAIRKSLYNPIDSKIINDDMALTIDLVKNGYRVVYEPKAMCTEAPSISIRDDFNVKVRMVFGGIQIIKINWAFLFPLRSIFSLQFFFHKVLRYFMWALLAVIYLSNIMLLNSGKFFIIFFGLQTLFYLFALIGSFLNQKNIQIKLFYLPFYYCVMNLAGFFGFYNFLFQNAGLSIWKKAQR